LAQRGPTFEVEGCNNLSKKKKKKKLYPNPNKICREALSLKKTLNPSQEKEKVVPLISHQNA
jgi:hypothetical protein